MNEFIEVTQSSLFIGERMTKAGTPPKCRSGDSPQKLHLFNTPQTYLELCQGVSTSPNMSFYHFDNLVRDFTSFIRLASFLNLWVSLPALGGYVSIWGCRYATYSKSHLQVSSCWNTLQCLYLWNKIYVVLLWWMISLIWSWVGITNKFWIFSFYVYQG